MSGAVSGGVRLWLQGELEHLLVGVNSSFKPLRETSLEDFSQHREGAPELHKALLLHFVASPALSPQAPIDPGIPEHPVAVLDQVVMDRIFTWKRQVRLVSEARIEHVE